MKKIIFLLAFISFLIGQESFAQPSYCFSPEQVEVEEGETVCLDLHVANFTDIISTQFTLTFDPEVLQFQNVSNFHPMVTGLDISDFGTTTAGLGYITFIWSDGQPCQSAVNGVTLFPDNQTLFTLCFQAIGDYGYHTPIQFASSPIDRITRRATAQCLDIGEDYVCDGFVSIGTSPLTINIGSADGYNGDVVCVDFKVKDFNDLVSAQYFVFWDTSVLQYYSAMTMGLGNAGDVYQTNYSPAYGMLASVWYTNNINVGVNLPDGTQILQMCFTIKGNCGQDSPIYISQNSNSMPPEPIEVIDAVTGASNEGVNIGLLQSEGSVSVNCINPNGITINMDDRNVCPGESFTVDVKVEDFNQIAKLMFNLKWNPAIIDYQSISYPVQPGSPNCLPFANGINEGQTGAGILEMDWSTSGQGCNKPDGYILFRLHFIATGPSSSNTTIAVVDPILVDKFGGQVVNIGINNNNSLVSICQLSNPTIIAESVNADPGSNVCIDFTVQDFDDITNMGYTIAWEPTVLQFTGLQGFNLNNLSLADFNTTNAGNLGVIGVDWSNATGVTMPDGISIFSACFDLVGDPDDCTVIAFENEPWPINVQTAVSNATNVGLNGQAGEVCTLNPFIFNVSLPDVYSGQNSNICVDLTVSNFNQLTNTEFSINWDPDVLSFTALNPSGALANFGINNYNTSDVADGNLTIDWAAANQILGTTLPNGTSIFELCFTVEGQSGECSPVTVSGFPQPFLITSATTGNANLNIGAANGSICVSGSINLVGYDVTDVSCGGNPDGSIDIQISGGSGQYSYNWSGPGVNLTAQDQQNIGVGNYAVTVTDVLNPSLQIVQPFNVVYTANATFANAGQDTIFSCGSFFMTLNGTGSSPGNYFWQSLGGGLVLPGQQNEITPDIIGGSLYKLTVTGTNPACVDTDTVQIASSQIPIPYIDTLTEQLSCVADTILLDGSMSPSGYDIEWTGPAVVPGTENFLKAKVTAPGMYILTLSSPVTGCAGMDTVMVESNNLLPTADAGQDQVLGCNDAFVPLGGAGTSTGLNFIYDWVPVGQGQICGNPQAASLNACSAGTFQLTVTDTMNGCFMVDEVTVTSDTLKPIATVAPAMNLNCTVEVVTLDGNGSSTGANLDYTWTLLPGTVVSQGALTTNVTSAGTYQLEVMNTGNGCSSVAQVVVQDLSNPPIITGIATNSITCQIDTSTLDATGSATGPGITYAWLNSANTVVGTSLKVSVNQPGDYQLVVTNSNNTCADTITVSVADGTALPTAEAGPNKAINCFGDPMLEGNYDSNNPDLGIIWSGPGQNCIQNGTTPTPSVSCPGWYFINVYNNITQCVGKDSVLVTDDMQPPTSEAGPAQTLGCAGGSIGLQGSTNATAFTAAWASVPAGLPISDPSSLTPTVSQPGTYTLTITSTLNGCVSSTDLVTVGLSPTNLQAAAGMDTSVDCQNTMATLNANGSTSGLDSLNWQQIGGSFQSNQPIVTVMAGTYMLTVYKEGCEDKDTVVVTNLAVDVLAIAAAGGDISCDNATVELNGNGSSAGPNITLVWTDENELIIGNGLTATVTATGIYTLTVTDTQTSCTATAQVTVIQNNDDLDAANAQADYAECESEAMLIGNLPAGTVGEWSSLMGATITEPTAGTTLVHNLVIGENQFVWTLSAGECLEYDSDTVTFFVNTPLPNAITDNATLQAGAGSTITFNVLENDVFEAANTSFGLLPFTGFGEVMANDSGDVTYTKEKCFVGKVEIPYQICDETCPALCDEGILLLDVKADAADSCDYVSNVPNGITPNGDGVNDALVFDILLDNSQEYPDNEIIIFNRWGDQVYAAKPYNNDWQGTNMGGQDLPQATYYYILRLNIADGKILRGDVSILK